MRLFNLYSPIIILLCSQALWASFDFSDLQSMVKAGKTQKALSEFADVQADLDEAIKKGFSAEKAFFTKEEHQRFAMGYALTAFESEQFDIAKVQFERLIDLDSSYSDFGNYFLGLISLKKGERDRAVELLQTSREKKPNYRLFTLSSLKLADVYLEDKKWKQARELLVKLEKRMRGEEKYPEVVYRLLRVEVNLDQASKACGWAKRLYSRFPSADVVAQWDLDLQNVEVDGQKLGCVVDTDEIAQRIRYLQLTGQDQRALKEVTLLKERQGTADTFEIDKVYAQFLTQEGESAKALEILLKHYEDKKSDQVYLNFLANVAARAGQTQLSIGMYYNSFLLNKKASKAANSLFQAAFTSYQAQDYDGASRKFQELSREYPKSNLAVDAIWHRGWIKYLKGDFEGAYQGFKAMTQLRKQMPRKFRSFQTDRLNYWMAMSLYRGGQVDQARVIMSNLKNDPLMGYYSILADQRIKSWGKETTIVEKIIRANGRYPAAEMMLPSDLSVRPVEFSGEYEIEESFASSMASPEEEGTLVETEDAPSGNDEAAEGDKSQVAQIKVEETFSNAALNDRFQKAQNLAFWGQIDFAKWELFEIERKTSKLESKKLLMKNYTELKIYNRAATIAQNAFGPERSRGGINEARDTWMATYPEAYADSVMEYSSDYGIPAELIWSIMRAETVYKKEAVSPVGAIGLMQVMAFTGEKLAKMVGKPKFDPKTLFEPDVAVMIGGKYLQRLSRKFEGSIPLIAAGYNAGPHRVKQWVWSFGYRDLDEFIEHIPFVETRNYVKKVVTNFVVYNRLYRQNGSQDIELTATVPNVINEPPPLRETWEEI